MTPARTTPLCNVHERLGARMIDFGGWRMPVQYDGILAEHQRTRHAVSLFDTCHMGQIDVRGAHATEALSRVLTAELVTMAEGQCRYGFMLNETGGVIDDLIAYRLAEDAWLLVVNAGTHDKDLEWLRRQLPAGPVLTDLSPTHGKIDVQGPLSGDACQGVLGSDLSGLGRFRFKRLPYRGVELVVSRTGYTGERGYEIYANAATIVELWDAFLAKDARPAGLGARDTLRLEAGLPLYGHELTEALTPVEAGLTRFASKASAFIGREPLVAMKTHGPERCLAGFMTPGRQAARHGNPVMNADGHAIGHVTSGSFSPTLGVSIGMAYVPAPFAIEPSPILINNGRRSLVGETVKLPFYRAEDRP